MQCFSYIFVPVLFSASWLLSQVEILFAEAEKIWVAYATPENWK